MVSISVSFPTFAYFPFKKLEFCAALKSTSSNCVQGSKIPRTKQSLSDSRKEISDLQASIRAHASEVGALQILVGGGHWQVGSDKQAYLTMPSDKEVREKANSAGLINDGIKVK